MSAPSRESLRVSVVIITWNRPTYVEQALKHLANLVDGDVEIVVVDASQDDRTRQVVDAFPDAMYVSFPGGAGHMTRSRNRALTFVHGDVIAFLDDDAMVRPEWLSGVRAAFAIESVTAMAGRTCNGQPGEESARPDQVGQFLANGELTGNFSAVVPSMIDITHGIGANMAFRASTLAQLGGFRTDYPGTALREDTDLYLRVRRLGGRVVFVPEAVADHVAAPHVRGKRFDRRYRFWGSHNHVLLIVRNYGYTNPLLYRWLGHEVATECATDKKFHRRAANLLILLAAVLGAVARLSAQRTFRPLPIENSGPEADEIRRSLRTGQREL